MYSLFLAPYLQSHFEYCFEKNKGKSERITVATISKTDICFLHGWDQYVNVLKPYLNKFDTPPNIVILIVEGLNDDFIHEYKGVNLMPFTSKLIDKSLYWNRCFTLAERSFAVVPSLLGSLPYGEKGFTLLDKLPKHLSLGSILNANNYHTPFSMVKALGFTKKKGSSNTTTSI